MILQVKWIGRRSASNWEPSFEFFSVSATSSMPSGHIYGGLMCYVLYAGSDQICTGPSRVHCTDGRRRMWHTGCGLVAIQVLAAHYQLENNACTTLTVTFQIHYGKVISWVQGQMQDLPKGDWPWRARGARAYNGGLRAGPPVGSRNRALGGVQGAKLPWSWKLLVYFHTKGAKS